MGNVRTSEAEALRKKIYAELDALGLEVVDRKLQSKNGTSKDSVRLLHLSQRNALLKKNARFLDKWEDRLLNEFASGSDVDPKRIQPEVVAVEGDGFDAALFRFATLHWSVPVSVGYGRRTRFLVRDKSNGKLIGVFALGDPVYNLRVRDNEIGWDIPQRNARLYNVLDAFVLGALPPYRQLLGSKLIAMVATSNEVASVIEAKYRGQKTTIANAEKDPRLVLITSTSALGRSSLFNRLKYRDRLLYSPMGFTEGFGHFQFSEDLFKELRGFIENGSNPKEYAYGKGPNFRMRTLRKAFDELEIRDDLLHHGVKREVYLAPRARNWKAFLRGETDRPLWYRLELDEIGRFHRRRWAVPRSERDQSFEEWNRSGMRVSPLLDDA